MSAEALLVPEGEVLLDGRVMRPDGSWSGVKVAGEVVRADVGMPSLVFGRFEVEPANIRADVFYFETFMERLTRDLRKRDGGAS